MTHRGRRPTQQREERPRPPSHPPGDSSRRQVTYPIATLACYGPDDKTITKIAVGILESEDAEPIMERWYGTGVATDPEVQAQIAALVKAHGAQRVVMTQGVMGCPHEEGIDFPEGEECPYCPFWRGKQGIHLR